jgi:hypothetical protein
MLPDEARGRKLHQTCITQGIVKLNFRHGSLLILSVGNIVSLENARRLVTAMDMATVW